MSDNFPTQAQCVIVGGGIMGVSLAYHLGHLGWRDVVLLEKAELTSGSTWHAAGQITQSTSSYGLGKCVEYNIHQYSGALEAETGQPVTWHGCGSLRLAYSTDELDWLRHTLSVGRSLGFNIELITPAQIADLHPFYNLDGVLAALHTPDDGHVDPATATMGFAAGARQLGVRIIRRCRATDISQNKGGEWVVATEQGMITCAHIVNAGGTYARQMGEWSGLQLPMTSMTHHYFVTENVPEFMELASELPVVRDDRLVSGYIRMEQKKGLIGIYEKENPNTVWEDFCPWEAENELFKADYDRVMPWLENALERMPVLSTLGISREVHGAISHPPDGNPLIGPAPGVQNYWCCCGVQIGIGWGPGLARELARWMVEGAADINMREFDPRRFGSYAKKDWQVTKAKEDYCLRHEIPFPHFNRLAGRPVKPGPLYAPLQEKGAIFEEVYGHERPRWFAREGVAQQDHYSFRRNIVHELVSAEVKAVCEAAGIMDITAFTKIEVCGAEAAALLDRLVANHLPRRDGGIALTHMLNEAGRIELETTLIRLAVDRFYLVCAAFFEQRLLDHLDKYRENMAVDIILRSDDWAALALNGPLARRILASCSESDVSHEAFPWLRAQNILIAGHECLALRMSYAGELGWEFHMPRESMQAVYAALWEAGADLGLRDYGSFAMNAMRMEKAFKGAGELTNEVTPQEADVMRFVKTDKDFIGKEAMLKAPVRFVCAYIEIDSDGIVDGHGGEAVLLEGTVIGSTASVAYGPRTSKTLAFAYIKPEAHIAGQNIEVVVAGTSRPARVLGNHAVYDPESKIPRQ